MKFWPQYLNTRIIQLSKQASKKFSFPFKTMSHTEIEKEIKSLDRNIASHSSDLPRKTIKTKTWFFSRFISGYLYKSISFFCFGQYFLFHIFMPGKGNLWKILLGCAIFEFDFIVHLLLLLLRGCWNHASYFCLLWWFYRSWADWFHFQIL